MSKAPLVAIVDDDEFFRGSMRRLMRSLGYTVEAFPSAAVFLASRRLDNTTCLIADIQMPGMTGVELNARLIEAGRKIPTILVTAYPDEVTRARALKDGVVCYLRKPFDDNDLMDCIRKAVEGGRPPAEDS
jgi:FixJ family two-component response regulator